MFVSWSPSRRSLTLLLSILAGCLKDSSGSSSGTGPGADTPLAWVDQSASATGTGGDTPLLWVDVVEASNQNPFGIASTDERTYGAPDVYVPNSTHPLMTRTTSNLLIAGEDQVASRLNNFRWMALTGGAFIIDPPVPVGSFYLPVSNALRKNARAHCKHYAGFHAGPLQPTNPEGDDVAGRLRKSAITTSGAAEIVLSGAAFADPDAAADEIIAHHSSLLTGSFTYFGVGHFLGGDQTAYWSVVFAVNPIPVQ